MKRRILAALALSAAAALTITMGALGGAPTRVPVTFDLSWETCSQLPEGTVIHGTGTALFSVDGSGGLHSVITGSATDGHGGSWRFDYSQDMRQLGGGAVEVTDHFNLVGSGSPIKLHSHFVADFTSSDLESAEFLALKQIHGDPIGCDPI
jgi:hypothetical protein